MKHFVAVIIVLLASFGTVAAAIGNQWLALKEDNQSIYVAGVLDTWEMSSEMTLKRMSLCLTQERMIPKQVTAITNKYLTERPELWGGNAATLIFVALYPVYERCEKLDSILPFPKP